MDEDFPPLPPPVLDLPPSSDANRPLPATGKSLQVTAGESGTVAYRSWQRYQQKKLLTLNRLRAAQVQDVPALDHVSLDIGQLGVHPSSEPLRKHVLSLLQQLLPQDWAPVKWEELELERLGGAMTNIMFVCRYSSRSLGTLGTLGTPTAPVKPVLLRIYGHGSDNLFARERELYMLTILSSMEVGPRLLATFGNGRFEEFLEDAVTLDAERIRDPQVSRGIAEQMFDLHSLVGIIPPVSPERNGISLEKNGVSPEKNGVASPEKRGSPSFGGSLYKKYHTELWNRLEDWYEKALLAIQVLRQQQPHKYEEITATVHMRRLREELDDVRERLSALESPVVFTHNDTQYGNIMQRTTDQSILIIDYEYAGYNYRAFDMANHFCEWAANYHCATPHVMDFVGKYPTRAQQLNFFHAYLDERDRCIQIHWKEEQKNINNNSKSPMLVAGLSDVVAPPPAMTLGPPATTSNHHTQHPHPVHHPIAEMISLPPMAYHHLSPRLRPQPDRHLRSAHTSPHPSPSLSPLLTPVQLKHLRNQEVLHLANEVNHFVLASHLMWALWGLIQASTSIIEFDYVGYALGRLLEYRRWRREVLGWTGECSVTAPSVPQVDASRKDSSDRG